MSARLDPQRPCEAHATDLHDMTVASLDEVMALESEVYPFTWTRGNFVDSLAAGYTARTLRAGKELIGYCVAMQGVGEMHLLNITVAAALRRHGHAQRMLADLLAVCRQRQASRLWLEVRVSNAVARAVYLRLGFAHVGVRKGYYPAASGAREDATVMSLSVESKTDGDALD